MSTAPMHANLLSYARSIQPGEARFFGARSGEPVIETGGLNMKALKPAQVNEVSVRGQISNYISEKKDKEFNIGQPNPQVIDKAKLPADTDRLVITAPVQVLDNVSQPHACSDKTVGNALTDFVQTYRERGGFEELAKRYAWNILNGRWLWRNYLVTTNKRIYVFIDGEYHGSVNPEELGKRNYPGDGVIRDAYTGFDDLVQAIADALSGRRDVLNLWLVAEGQLPELAEVFPSEEMVQGDEAERIRKRRGGNSAGKVLSSVRVEWNGDRVRQPTFHPQKIGNAIRCIDEWYDSDEVSGAVAVDPYAGLTQWGMALRPNGNGSLYDYLTKRKWCDQIVDAVNQNDPKAFGNAHFVVGCLVRGGVFGGE